MIGLAHFVAAVFVGSALALIATLLWGEWWYAALMGVGVGMALGSSASVRAGHTCVVQLRPGPTRLVVHLSDPGEGTGAALIPRANCIGPIIIRWPASARIPAGADAIVEGKWIRGDPLLGVATGTLDVVAFSVKQVQPSFAERTRTLVDRRAHRMFGRFAPLAIAMLTGHRGELDDSSRVALAATGMMHLFTVSGLQVAALVGWIWVLLRCRAGRHPAELIAASCGVGYAAWLGWPPAATRASALLLIAAFCRARQRNPRVDATLALSALVVLLIDPLAIATPGFWMSVVGVTGIVVLGRWSARALGRSYAIRTLAAGTAAVAATAPISVAMFAQVPVASILLPFVTVPIFTAAYPAALVAILLPDTLGILADAFARSACLLLAGLDGLARWAASFAAVSVEPSPTTVVWCALPALSLCWMIAGRATALEAARRGCWVATALLLVTGIGWVGPSPVVDGQLRFIFANVGQGDGILIETPHGHWIEVDAGPIAPGFDAGHSVMLPLLRKAAAERLDLFVLSHAHRDHVGGGASVVQAMPVDLALEPGELFSDTAYATWLQELARRQVRWRRLRAGDGWTLDGVAFRVIHPPVPWARAGQNLNEDSAVLEVHYGRFSALLMGDAGFVTESVLVHQLHHVDLLKVGHHGSATATSDSFLAAIRPRLAVISVGHNNYGHPSPATLRRLASAGVEVWRTDSDGTVTVRTNGVAIDVKGQRGAATFGTAP